MRLPVNLTIRGWKRQVLVFKETLQLDSLDEVPALAERHTRLVAGEPHLIELEFLDIADPQERFLRFGTERSMMREPILLDDLAVAHCAHCGAAIFAETHAAAHICPPKQPPAAQAGADR